MEETASGHRLPKRIIDRVLPGIQQKRTWGAVRKWLTLTRKLGQIKDYLPFVPHDTGGSAKFGQYEKLTNETISQLRSLLDNDFRAQKLAKVGRAFRHYILKRETFIWADWSSEEISNVPNEELLHVLTIRRNSIGNQCDLCAGDECQLLTCSQTSVSRQPISAPRDVRCEGASFSTVHHNNISDKSQTMETPTSLSALRLP